MGETHGCQQHSTDSEVTVETRQEPPLGLWLDINMVTLSQGHGFRLHATSDGGSAARFLLAPPTNPHVLSDGRTDGQQELRLLLLSCVCSDVH